MSPARRTPDTGTTFVDFHANPEAQDPAVNALLSQGEHRQAEARLSKTERKRARKERERAQARMPGRINLDISESLKAQLIALAEYEGVPLSQLAAFLLLEALARHQDGEIEFWSYKRPSRSPKFTSVLDLELRRKELARKARK